MPWKDMRVDHQKIEFILRALEEDANVTELCREFGISRKTAYKWLARYEQEGCRGLSERSRRPIHSPLGVSSEAAMDVVRLRLEHPHWGPKKLRVLLQREGRISPVPSVSTIARVLARTGLSECRGRGRPRRWTPARPAAPARSEYANGLWTVDLKGWWRTRDGQRCEPFTARDAYSRYIVGLVPVAKRDRVTLRGVFETIFDRYGLPEAILSDNGSPFSSVFNPWGLTQLSAWWRLLGVRLVRTQPGHPEQNGAHERMHADIAREIQAHAATDWDEECRRLDAWRTRYNLDRPHEALGMRVPAELYRRSPRRFEGTPVSWDYPAEFDRLRIRAKGAIKITGGKEVFISQALRGLSVGLERTSVSTLRVWFCDLLLGEISLNRGGRFTPFPDGKGQKSKPKCYPSPDNKVLPMSEA